MLRTPLALAGALLTAGLALTSAPAHAQAVTVDDGTGDVWTQVVDEESGELVWVTEDVDNADVVKTVYKHTAKRIAVTATYVDLNKNSDFIPTYATWFKLSDGRQSWLSVDAWEGEPSPWFTIEKEPGGKWDRKFECPGLKMDWHWDTDVFTASFPRSCFDDPKWVRFHGVAWRSAVDYTNDRREWVDDAHDGDPTETLTDGPFTDKLKAG